MADGGPSQSPNFRPGNLSPPSGSGHSTISPLWDTWIALWLWSRERKQLPCYLKQCEPASAWCFFSFLVERMLTILRNASEDILSLWDGGLNSLKKHIPSLKSASNEYSRNSDSVGLSDMPEEGEFANQYKWQISQLASQALLCCLIFQLKLSGLKRREARQTWCKYIKGRHCFRGTNMGIIVCMTRNKVYILKKVPWCKQFKTELVHIML